MPVEVIDVFGNGVVQLALVDGQHPVEQLTAWSAHPALGDGVRSGACGGMSRTWTPSLAKTCGVP
jgi:hypothetical protein